MTRLPIKMPRVPRPTVRLRLTTLYGGLFLASGAALLAITYLLARTGRFLTTRNANGTRLFSHPATGEVPAGAILNHAKPLPNQQAVVNLHQLLMLSGVALAIMALVSVALGWLVAGRILSRLQKITRAAREISADNLHQRLSLEGPDDELAELSSTFDQLLTRLEESFDAERRFVANASHELRTPLARQRALIEVALSDPDATVGSLQANNRRLLAAGEQQERLIEALLVLARSEHGSAHHESLDLAAIAGKTLAAYGPEARRRQIDIQATLGPAPSSGDPRLVERLIANLIDNAIRHNTLAGQLTVQTGVETGAGASADQAVFTISNSGSRIPPEDVARLLRPFQRLESGRRVNADGAGLGLSIARAISDAHGASLTALAHERGGLRIQVRFPLLPTIPRETTRATWTGRDDVEAGHPRS